MFLKGGLFEHEFHGQELAFKYAVRKINRRSDLLPNTQLVYDIQQTPVQDSFLAAKRGMYTSTYEPKSKGSICLLYKWANTPFWLCRAEW